MKDNALTNNLGVEERRQFMECPPVDPQLIAHLDVMFSDPGETARPTNPLLGQLLTIQYGVDKIKKYLKTQYQNQSAAARRAYDK